VASLHDTLAKPVPAHLLTQRIEEENDGKPLSTPPVRAPAPLVGDLTKLPLPVSHLLGSDTGKRLSSKGESILRAIRAPTTNERLHVLPRREAILRALTDDAYS